MCPDPIFESQQQQSNDNTNSMTKESLELINWFQTALQALPPFLSLNNQHQREILEFLSTSSPFQKLIAYTDDSELKLNVVPTKSLDGVQKILYFVKVSNNSIHGISDQNEVDPITPTTIQARIHSGSLTGRPIKSLFQHMQTVHLPTFLSTIHWPESVKKDVTGQMNVFLAALTESAQSLKNRTVLYLPVDDKMFNSIDPSKPSTHDKEFVQRLESVIIQCSRQIKELITQSEYSSDNGQNGVLEEIMYWTNRTKDLSGIITQLTQPPAVKMISILTSVNSPYLSPFHTIVSKLTISYDEARENLKYLPLLRPLCEQLSTCQPKQVSALLFPILCQIRIIWSQSQYYHSDERLTSLLRKITNQIISQCRAVISLNDIFDGKVTEAMKHLHETKVVGAAWKQCFSQMVRLINKNAKSSEGWNFDPDSHGVYAQLDAFVQRCVNLIEVCEGQLQFARRNLEIPPKPETALEDEVEKLYDEFGEVIAEQPRKQSRPKSTKRHPTMERMPNFKGLRAKEIQRSLLEIEVAFNQHVDKLRSLNYDILNVKASNWYNDFNQFKQAMKDLEMMMINTLTSAWESVVNVEMGIDLCERFYHLCIRPSMQAALQRRVSETYSMFFNDVKRIKSEFERQKKNPVLASGEPQFAGSALWARSLHRTVSENFNFLTEANYMATKEQKEESTAVFSSLSTALESYVRQCHVNWSDNLHKAMTNGQNLTGRLHQPLLLRTNTGQLECNFDQFLLDIFNECPSWQSLGGDFPIPYIASEIYVQHDQLENLRECVGYLVKDYNSILDSLTIEEKKLFWEHLRSLDRKISPGWMKIKWTDKHIKEYFIKGCREKCKEISDIISHLHNNAKKIEDICNDLSEAKLIEIQKNTIYKEDLFEGTQIHHQNKIQGFLVSRHSELTEIVKSSYIYFKNQHSEIQREWLRYISKTDNAVEDALRKAVKMSLVSLLRSINGDQKNEAAALFRISIVLNETTAKVECQPTLADISNLVKKISRQSMTIIQSIPKLHPQWKNVCLEAGDMSGHSVTLADDVVLSHPPNAKSAAFESPVDPFIPSGSLHSGSTSFHDNISRDEDILKILVGIMHGSTNVAVELNKIVSHFDRYAPIWSTDKAAFMRRYASTKRPLASFDMDITRYKNSQGDVFAEDSYHHVNFLQVDCARLKNSLIGHCQQWQAKLTNLLHHNALVELESIHAFYDDNTEKLQESAESLDHVSEQSAILQHCTDEIAGIETKYEHIEEMYKCLDKFDIPLSEEEKELLDTMRMKGAEFAKLIVEIRSQLSGKLSEMKQEAEETSSLLQSQQAAED